MPGWLLGFARVQPIARAANTVRALTEGGPVDTKPFWTVRWSIAIPAVFAPWQSVATGRASTQRHPLPPKPREQMP